MDQRRPSNFETATVVDQTIVNDELALYAHRPSRYLPKHGSDADKGPKDRRNSTNPANPSSFVLIGGV